MKYYQRLYHNLVNIHKYLEEQWKPTNSGLERHHIVPRHAGGTDDPDNFTYLTHRQHIIAHWLLWKMHGLVEDLSAWKLMKGMTCYPSRLGAKHTDETKRKMSAAKKGPRRPHSEETKRKIGLANKGKLTGTKRPIASTEKMIQTRKRNGTWRKKHTEKHKRKMSEMRKGKPFNGMPPWNKGKKTGPQSKELIEKRTAWTKQPLSEETRRKRSIAISDSYQVRQAQKTV